MATSLLFAPFGRRRCDAIRAAHASIENRLALVAALVVALGALGWLA